MNPQGAGAKIKGITHKNNPQVPDSGTSSPLHAIFLGFVSIVKYHVFYDSPNVKPHPL